MYPFPYVTLSYQWLNSLPLSIISLLFNHWERKGNRILLSICTLYYSYLYAFLLYYLYAFLLTISPMQMRIRIHFKYLYHCMDICSFKEIFDLWKVNVKGRKWKRKGNIKYKYLSISEIYCSLEWIFIHFKNLIIKCIKKKGIWINMKYIFIPFE